MIVELVRLLLQALFFWSARDTELMIMYTLKAGAAFDSAHFLAGYNGKCRNIHGHRWTVEAEFCGNELCADGDKRGMLIDFGDLKRELREIAEQFDHALIYERGSLKETTLAALDDEGFRLIEIPVRPTAENLARMFYDKLAEKGMPVCEITVYETPDNCASYRKD